MDGYDKVRKIGRRLGSIQPLYVAKGFLTSAESKRYGRNILRGALIVVGLFGMF